MSVTSMLAEIIGDRPTGGEIIGDRPTGDETIGGPTGDETIGGPTGADTEPIGAPPVVAAIPPQHRAPVALKIRRCEPEEGPAFWRWDCARCGEYGGGRHHADAVTRAMRHCTEHPDHRSSLLPPVRCRTPEVGRLAVHPALFAVDDDPPPVPLAI